MQFSSRLRRTSRANPGEEPTRYTYDVLDRLRTVQGPGLEISLEYGPTGERYRRVENGVAVATYFGEWVEQRDGQTRRLIHGPGVDNVLAEVASVQGSQDPPTTYPLLRDARNNVIRVDVASPPPPAVGSRQYDAFEATRLTPDFGSVERGYASRGQEGSSGLIYMRARHYDPSTGRFLQQDPLGLATRQLYTYASNNPYVYSDPSGLLAETISEYSSEFPDRFPGFSVGAQVGATLIPIYTGYDLTAGFVVGIEGPERDFRPDAGFFYDISTPGGNFGRNVAVDLHAFGVFQPPSRVNDLDTINVDPGGILESVSSEILYDGREEGFAFNPFRIRGFGIGVEKDFTLRGFEGAAIWESEGEFFSLDPLFLSPIDPPDDNYPRPTP